jgi:putative ABC transport system permease protein
VKLGRALTLARRNLQRNRRGAVLSALGVAVGVGCLVFFTALGQGVSHVVRTKLFPTDSASVEVVPPQVSIGALFGAGKLDDALLARLAAIPGVRDALPKMTLRVNAASWYNEEFFGHPLKMGLDIVAVGVDPRLVQSDVMPNRDFTDRGPGKPVPTLVSTKMLEVYNKTFAPSRGLPRLSPEMLAGFHFPIEFGKSFINQQANARIQAGYLEVVGFSDRALLGGATIPLETARRLNREYNQDADTYSSVVLRATSADAIPSISAEVRKLGFEIDDSEQKLSEQVGWGILMVTAALGLLSVLISGLAAVNIAHAFYASVRERRREIGVLRAVGASSNDVLRVLLAEASLVGLAGGLLGVVGGTGAAFALDAVVRRYVPDFPYKPDTFFQFSALLVFGGLAVALAAAVGGAFPPARSAARAEPAQSLTE